MSKLFDMLMNVVYSIAGYITSFFGYLYNALYSLIAYITVTILNWIFYCISWFIILILYVCDSVLCLLVYTLNQIFGGNVFDHVGISISAIENNLDVILAVAPYALTTSTFFIFDEVDKQINDFFYSKIGLAGTGFTLNDV